jgi:hypothetical protein
MCLFLECLTWKNLSRSKISIDMIWMFAITGKFGSIDNDQFTPIYVGGICWSLSWWFIWRRRNAQRCYRLTRTENWWLWRRKTCSLADWQEWNPYWIGADKLAPAERKSNCCRDGCDRLSLKSNVSNLYINFSRFPTEVSAALERIHQRETITHSSHHANVSALHLAPNASDHVLFIMSLKPSAFPIWLLTSAIETVCFHCLKIGDLDKIIDDRDNSCCSLQMKIACFWRLFWMLSTMNNELLVGSFQRVRNNSWKTWKFDLKIV